jgi:hypothetical protein
MKHWAVLPLSLMTQTRHYICPCSSKPTITLLRPIVVFRGTHSILQNIFHIQAIKVWYFGVQSVLLTYVSSVHIIFPFPFSLVRGQFSPFPPFPNCSARQWEGVRMVFIFGNHVTRSVHGTQLRSSSFRLLNLWPEMASLSDSTQLATGATWYASSSKNHKMVFYISG